MRPKRLADGAAMPPPNAAQKRARDRVRRHAQPDAVLAAGDGIVHVRRARQDQRQRPGPESRRRAATRPRGTARAHCAESRGSCTMHDDRMVGGPSFRRENARDGVGVGSRRRRVRRRFRSEMPRARRRAGARGTCDAASVGASGAPHRSAGAERATVRASRPSRQGLSTGRKARSEILLKFMLLRDARAPVERGEQGAAMSEFPIHVGVGVGRPSGQGRGPDFRCGARRDSRARSDGRVAAETLVSTGLVVMAGEITTAVKHDYAPHRARHDPPDRLQRPRTALRRRRLRGDGLLRQAVARHRARRRPRVRRIPEPGRRRPGPDVRLRVRRDAVADAVPDLLRASAGPAAERSAQATAACRGCGPTPSRR